MFGRKIPGMITPAQALPGRTDQTMPVPEAHFEKGTSLTGPWAENMQTLVVGMGCFWGAERIFWQQPGVHSTSVGYAGGYTPNPTYEEVCSGLTGHTEVLTVVYDSWNLSLMDMLRVFWENHNPTQGMRQGNDMGTQYRSAIYYGEITTEIAPLTHYYFAEPYHQQYLGKNPNGYCGIGGTGVSCSIGIL
jgi:peptide-methionine (S)-S-oxide reductase